MSFGDREEPVACEGVVYNGLRIIVTEFDSSQSEDVRRSQPWVMDITCWQARKLGKPTADVVAIGVESLSLGHRIEYAEVRLGVTTAAADHCQPALF